jgi:ribosomal protein S12 methylthiotransferase accessory factor
MRATQAINTSLEGFLSTAAEYLIDSRTGIVRHVFQMRRQAGAPNFFHFVARSARSDPDYFAESGGASTNRSLAMAKAIGEVIERYCAGLFDTRLLPLVAAADAPFACADPASFALYSREQYEQPGFPFVPFDRTARLRWVEARDLALRAPTHVPAGKVFLPYRWDRDAGEHPNAQTITTGLASHSTYEEAVVNAVCEVVERDAFTIMWQARMSMPTIRIESLTDEHRDLIDRFTHAGAELRIVNLTMDHGIPTVLTVLRHRSKDAPAVLFAASADLDPEVAVTKSLEELVLMKSFAHWLMAKQPPLPLDTPYDSVRTREDHVRFHCDAERAGLSAFVIQGEAQDLEQMPNLATGNPVDDVELLVRRIGSVDERVLVVDLTSDELRQLGLRVVRVLIPGFQPLVFGHRLRALGGERLWTVPQKLGYAGIARFGGDQPVPHPFP